MIEETVFECEESDNRVTIPLDESWRTLGILFSGGLDSFLTSYLTIKTIQEKKLDLKVRLISFDFATKPAYLPTAKKLAWILQWLTGFENFEPHYKFAAPLEQSKNPAKKFFISNHASAMFVLDAIQYIYDGLTKNPPLEVMQKFPAHEHRQIDRDVPNTIYRHPEQASPLAFCDKQGVVELYKRYDLVGSVLSKTFSCDANKDDVVDGQLPCRKCWWCYERAWGLKMNGLDPGL